MTLFTNGFVTLKIPKDFKTVVNKGNFVELSLINPQIPLSIKFLTTPTLAGLTDLKVHIEETYKNSPIELNTSDFVAIGEDIYYYAVTSIADGKEIRRNEFFYIRDNNLYTFEFAYPYADAELDQFYLNIIDSLKINKAKYIVGDDGYYLNED